MGLCPGRRNSIRSSFPITSANGSRHGAVSRAREFSSRGGLMNGHALGSSLATPRESGFASRQDVPAVEVRDLTKEFGAAPALDNVSLAIQPGEFFSLLGPSGCGKTTLMRIIGGFENPPSGEVRIGGRGIANEPPLRRPTNLIFPQFALVPLS